MSLYKFGMTVLGTVFISFFIGATIILLFNKQLADIYGPTPPLWMWKTVGITIIIGAISFITSLIGLITERE